MTADQMACQRVYVSLRLSLTILKVTIIRLANHSHMVYSVKVAVQ